MKLEFGLWVLLLCCSTTYATDYQLDSYVTTFNVGTTSGASSFTLGSTVTGYVDAYTSGFSGTNAYLSISITGITFSSSNVSNYWDNGFDSCTITYPPTKIWGRYDTTQPSKTCQYVLLDYYEASWFYGESGRSQFNFTPTSAGDYYIQARLLINNGGNRYVYPSSGTTDQQDWFVKRYKVSITRPPVPSVSPNPYSFGDVTVGGYKDKTFTVSNIGGGTLSGSVSGGSPFSIVSGSPYNIPGGSSASVKVRFAPTSAGYSSVQANFTGGGGVTVSIDGNGVTRSLQSVVFSPTECFEGKSVNITVNGSNIPSSPYVSIQLYSDGYFTDTNRASLGTYFSGTTATAQWTSQYYDSDPFFRNAQSRLITQP
ncbi:MAG: choice-of-anchor D domain-containing protein [Candidatus Wallbacteria bacterium]|nr:choice-of-anchor D domain-containing protein [Candidatus Wallbacteria bacterium]